MSDKPSYGRSPNSQYSTSKLSGLELAAAAAAAPGPSQLPQVSKAVSFVPSAPSASSVPSHSLSRTTSAPPLTTGPNPRTNTKGKTIYSTPFKTYQAPIHKSHKVFIDSHSPPNHPDNRPIRYLAVLQRTEVCAKCFAAEPTLCTCVKLTTARIAPSLVTNSPIVCRSPPPGWEKRLPNADYQT